MNDNSAGALVFLVLAILLLPVVVVVFLLWLIVTKGEAIAAGMTVFAQAVWLVHKNIGYGLLWLVRDLPVLSLPAETWPDAKVRKAVVLWLAVVPPLLLGGIWFFLAALFSISSLWKGLVVLAPSMMAITAGYFISFFEQPVSHYRWPRFLAQYHLLRAEGQLAYIERSLELRFWFEGKKNSVPLVRAQDE